MIRGYPSQAAADPNPAAPGLVLVVNHHDAKIYRVDKASQENLAVKITPYDPHHFLHHLAHEDQSRQEGQRAPEDTEFYKRIADAVSTGGRIVVVGHGTGKSNSANHLIEYLRTHHRETYERIVTGRSVSPITNADWEEKGVEPDVPVPAALKVTFVPRWLCGLPCRLGGLLDH